MMMLNNNDCPNAHAMWTAKEVELANGRKSLREFCASCGRTNSGTRLGFALPMTRDGELKVASFKHKDKTLREIFDTDPDYLRWIVAKSGNSERTKKAAARLVFNDEYIPPTPGDTYPAAKCYDPTKSYQYIEEIINTFKVVND